MKNQVHVAIQIVPITKGDAYALIDRAIEVIGASGVDYRVGAMETVMQGEYNQLLDLARKAQQACLDAGADEVVVTMKVHAKRNGDVTWEDKLGKY
jgi:uncharacterized protein YqgV (UPF0045/DUF77 family)